MNCVEVQTIRHPNSGESCTNCHSGRLVKVSENKSSFTLKNPQRREVCIVHVDDCMETKNIAKCDYLILVCSCDDAYFIELKGTKLARAVEQLDATIQREQKRFNGKIFARAIVSKVANPKAIRNLPSVKKLRRRVEATGGTFEYGARSIVEKLS